jgi:uncharacterized membrane protein
VLRLQFRERPWDLYLSIGYSVALGTILIVFGGGNLLAILLVLLVPGYVLIGALFPSGKEIDWIERIALSFGLSIAVVPLLGLVLNFTPFGVGFAPLVGIIALFTVVVGMFAYLRRMRLPPMERLSIDVDLVLPNWGGDSTVDKLITIILSASIVAAAGVLVYVLEKPHPDVPFTAFSILGPTGRPSDYPTRLNSTQPGTVIIGVANHEVARVNYALQIDLVSVNLVYNATAGVNETVEGNRTTWSWFNFSLAGDQNWTQVYTFSIPSPGIWKVQFLLFKAGTLLSAYRELHLYVVVT